MIVSTKVRMLVLLSSLIVGFIGISDAFASTKLQTTANLILNSSNEDALVNGEIPHWHEAIGNNWTQRQSDPEPKHGSAYFFAGVGANAELYQDIDVSSYAGNIDQSQQTFTFSGYVRAWHQSPADSSRIIVEYRNVAGQVIDTFDSGEVSVVPRWDLIQDVRIAPTGTRSIRIRLISTRYNGDNNDGYYDDLMLSTSCQSCAPNDGADDLNDGRNWHTATLLQSGNVLVAGGWNGGTYLSSAELYDPLTGKWRNTGSLATPRNWHTATLLPNGKVLVAGGYRGPNGLGNPTASAELYDPATGQWRTTGSLSAPRAEHTATLLSNGNVLVVGGYGRFTSAELYDPATGTWRSTGNLSVGSRNHTATLLPSGEVLVTGGWDAQTYRARAEIYNPTSETWRATGSMDTPRAYHTATLLPTGKVLVTGGVNSNDYLESAELYDPATENWLATGSMTVKRDYHTATLLPNGNVLVTGGLRQTALANIEIYNTITGIWSSVEDLTVARAEHTATLLPSGKVVIAGGCSAYTCSNAIRSTELYDPAQPSWRPTGNLNYARDWHTTTLLPNGKLLVAGGYNNSLVGSQITGHMDSAELYDPTTGQWTRTESLQTARNLHTAILLSTGEVLVAGGVTLDNIVVSNSELYDPVTNSWRPTGALNEARGWQAGTTLADGRVLLVGGVGSNGSWLSSAELYDRKNETWQHAGSMNLARDWHTATLLPSGKVLVTGGLGASGAALNSAELYDPATGQWTVTGSLTHARIRHAAVLLPTGKVLVVGGEDSGNVLNSAELYDPVTEQWTDGGNMVNAHTHSRPVLLADGTVLVTGGWGSNGAAATAELYDPATKQWRVLAGMGTRRGAHTSTLMPNGQVIVVGGWNNNAQDASSEIFDIGLNFDETWRPQIVNVTSPLPLNAKLHINGDGLRGIAEAFGGNTSDSATDYPLVQLRRLESGQQRWLLPDVNTSFSDTTFTSEVVENFPLGPTALTLFVNGIPSRSKMIMIGNEDDNDQCENRADIDVMLLIDRSDSMRGQPFNDAKSAAQTFMGSLNQATDQAGLVSFGDPASLDHTLTGDYSSLNNAIVDLQVNGWTNIADALTKAKSELASSRHNPNNQPLMILLSDGEATRGGSPVPIAEQAKSAGIRIIVIGLSIEDAATLRAIASSPDDYHPAPTSDELEAIYTELAQTVGCPMLQVSPLVVNLQAMTGQTAPVTATVSVRNGSPGVIPWTATDDQPWLTVSPTGGNTPTDLTVAADASALSPSVYQATLTVSSDDSTVLNSPQTVIVNLIVSEPDDPPTEPMTLTAVSGYDSIDLEWTVPNSTDLVDYQVERRPENSSIFQPIAETDRPRHNDADPTLIFGQTYCYQVKARRTDGSTIVASNEACAVLGEVELWVPDVWGAPRELVLIPINIRNPHGLQIAAADIWLDFDNTILTPVGIVNTPLTAGYTWDYNIQSIPGSPSFSRVLISTYNLDAPALHDDGSLFWLQVEVAGSEGDETRLNLRELIADVGGTAIYVPTNLTSPLPVTLQDGVFYVSADWGLGDLNNDGIINAPDAYIAVAIAVGRITPTQQQVQTGDVNGDGAVDAGDATMILHYAAHGRWWSVNAVNAASHTMNAEPVLVSLDDVNGEVGSVVTTNIRIAQGAEMAGAHFAIAYDPNLIAIETVRPTDATAEFTLDYTDGNGLLRIALAAPTALAKDGAIVEVTLRLKGTTPTSAPLIIADAELSNAAGQNFAGGLQRVVQEQDAVVRIGAAAMEQLYLPLIQR